MPRLWDNSTYLYVNETITRLMSSVVSLEYLAPSASTAFQESLGEVNVALQALNVALNDMQIEEVVLDPAPASVSVQRVVK